MVGWVKQDCQSWDPLLIPELGVSVSTGWFEGLSSLRGRERESLTEQWWSNPLTQRWHVLQWWKDSPRAPLLPPRRIWPNGEKP